MFHKHIFLVKVSFVLLARLCRVADSIKHLQPVICLQIVCIGQLTKINAVMGLLKKSTKLAILNFAVKCFNATHFKNLHKHDCTVVDVSISLSVSDERESVQKKTFQKWVNSHLARIGCRINDLYIDMRDGKMLMKLLEILSGERLVSGYRETVSNCLQ